MSSVLVRVTNRMTQRVAEYEIVDVGFRIEYDCNRIVACGVLNARLREEPTFVRLQVRSQITSKSKLLLAELARMWLIT